MSQGFQEVASWLQIVRAMICRYPQAFVQKRLKQSSDLVTACKDCNLQKVDSLLRETCQTGFLFNEIRGRFDPTSLHNYSDYFLAQ